jgi:predicted nuclease with TOPRIM domain
MNDELRARLVDLRAEFEVGERRLRELEQQQQALRDTLLRISGAIQVLQELTGEDADSAPGTLVGSQTAAEIG